MFNFYLILSLVLLCFCIVFLTHWEKDFFCWSVFYPSVLLWHTARTETHSHPTYVTCMLLNTQTRTLLCRMWLKGQAPYRLWHGRRKEGCEQSVCDSGGAGRRDSGLRSRRHDTLLVSPLPMSAQHMLKDSKEKQRRRGRDSRGDHQGCHTRRGPSLVGGFQDPPFMFTNIKASAVVHIS